MTELRHTALPESADDELARLRRVAIVDQLLTTLVGVLDPREIFAQVSAVAARVLPYDAIALPVFTGDGHPVMPFAAGEPFEIIEDAQAEPERDRHSASLGFRSVLRAPIRFEREVIALLVVQSRAAAVYRPADAAVARRIADYVALALSYQRLADRTRSIEELRARTATLELLDDLLITLTDTGDLPDVFDRVSEIARKVLPHDTLLMIVGLPGGRRAKLFASSGTGAEPFPDEYDVPPSIVADRQWDAEVIDDLSHHPVWRHEEGARRGYRACIEMAIRLDGELIAVLAFLSFAAGLYTEGDLLVARRIRDRLALSLTRGRGVEASKRAEEATARALLLESRVRELTAELNSRSGYRRVVGRSPAWRHVLTQAAQVAPTETTVLLLGESGTGKEVVARFVHRASARRDRSFVALNCAALPEQLLEAELFGYERGAFTGAVQSKPGQLEQAAGGILFLDEVAEMSVAAQAKFLRVLQEREFQRLGGTRVLKTDARIVAATNRDLQKAMARGHFREDLYYRLNVFAIHVPPLRERREDVLALADVFIQEIGRAIGRPPAGLSRQARQTLLDYHWPGNVRELRNVLERAAILCDGGLIATEHLALGVPAIAPPPPAPDPISTTAPAAAPAGVAAGDLHAMERALIAKAMSDARFNKSEAARALGLTRAQLYVRLRKHGLDKDIARSR
jgi:transcriptional regulator with GAF, ATPase, and Fis domain